jgi:hypothetical protein
VWTVTSTIVSTDDNPPNLIQSAISAIFRSGQISPIEFPVTALSHWFKAFTYEVKIYVFQIVPK